MGVMTSNPQAAGSIPAGRTRHIRDGYMSGVTGIPIPSRQNQKFRQPDAHSFGDS